MRQRRIAQTFSREKSRGSMESKISRDRSRITHHVLRISYSVSCAIRNTLYTICLLIPAHLPLTLLHGEISFVGKVERLVFVLVCHQNFAFAIDQREVAVFAGFLARHAVELRRHRLKGIEINFGVTFPRRARCAFDRIEFPGCY